MRNPHSPLDDQHLLQIRNAQPAIEKARAQIAMAKQAGINVDDSEKSLEAHAAKLQQIRNVYFPGE
jgi:hypothetical protein